MLSLRLTIDLAVTFNQSIYLIRRTSSVSLSVICLKISELGVLRVRSADGIKMQLIRRETGHAGHHTRVISSRKSYLCT